MLTNRPWRATAVAAATFVGVAGASLTVGAPAAHATPSTPSAPVTEIDALTTTTYGMTLEVGGNSPLAGAPLYMITSDSAGHFGCTTAFVAALGITCTGPESDVFNNVMSDEWPAFTTDGPLVAGPGVRQNQLRTVYRPGIGYQVTYAGHPLYLFDPPSSPFIPVGANFLETTLPLPPWQGLWGLVNATTGGFDAGPAVVETETLPSGATALATETYNNAVPGGVAVTVYASTGGDQGQDGHGNSRTWIPLMTQGAPQVIGGANPSKVGEVNVGNGQEQVTYAGRPLYLYASENPVLTSEGPQTTGTAGNGAGLPGPSGNPMQVLNP